MNDELNPYASAATPAPESHPVGDAAAIRIGLIKHEAEVRAVGLFLCVVGVILAGNIVVPAIATLLGFRARGDWSEALMAGFLLLLAAGIIRVGLGLRRFEPWSRPAGLAVIVAGLLYPPTTLFCAWSLYVLGCRKGKTVFTLQYAAIRAATPEMTCRRWTVMGVLLAFLFLLVAAALLSGFGQFIAMRWK